MSVRLALVIPVLSLFIAGCGDPGETTVNEPAAAQTPQPAPPAQPAQVKPRPQIYAPVTLTADLEHLSDDQRRMIGLLIDASDIMDGLFWRQAYGDRDALMSRIDGADARRFAQINYGPWDRLDGNKPFIDGVGPKPPGANYYPPDMTREEFDAATLDDKTGQYSLIRRNEDGALISVPYSEAYGPELEKAAALLREAAALAADDGFKKYLELRADALVTDDYQPSDLAWMDMKTNDVDVVIGPIETYEDQLFGYRAAFEGYVLIKDREWSDKLARFAAYLPELQQGLPVEARYKAETPGTDSDLNAYDVVYYAGDCNSGSKTIAINLPNDEEVQLAKGTRRLQLKNAMRAKFDKILVPIAGELIAQDQQKHVTFDAFFANTMFHEVAHGLGIKNTINDRGTVREALKELASSTEEGKADILGLYMITKLREKDEISDGELMDNYVTFLAGIFRSSRFGASSAHGRANMVRFNYFQDQGAFTREDGRYRVDFDRMAAAVDSLSRELLTLQGDGDYAATKRMLDEKGQVGPALQADLDRLAAASIPVDIVFEQGKAVLGL